MKPWTKKGRDRYALCGNKNGLAAECLVSRQSLSGYAHAKKGGAKAVQTPERVAKILAQLLGGDVTDFGQHATAKKGGK